MSAHPQWVRRRPCYMGRDHGRLENPICMYYLNIHPWVNTPAEHFNRLSQQTREEISPPNPGCSRGTRWRSSLIQQMDNIILELFEHFPCVATPDAPTGRIPLPKRSGLSKMDIAQGKRRHLLTKAWVSSVHMLPLKSRLNLYDS